MATRLPALRRFISSSRPLCKARKLAQSPKPSSKSPATPAPQPTSSKPMQVKLTMQHIPRWDDGWGTQGPRKDPAAIAARKKAQEKAEFERLRQAQKDAEKARLKSLGLSNVTYASAFKSGKLKKGLRGRVPYERMTALQVTALEQLRGGGNVLIQSTNLGISTSYLVPIISKHIEWADSAGAGSSSQEPLNPWLSYDAIPLPKPLKKNLKNPTSSLLDYGPGSIRVIILCPTAERAREVEKKCRDLVPMPTPQHQGKVGLSPKSQNQVDDAVHIVCLTHTKPSQSERDAALIRRSQVLITTPFPLLDHLINTKGFQKGLKRLRCVVFDHADKFPQPDWLPALREGLVTDDSTIQWVSTARTKGRTLDTIADLFLSDAGYSSVIA